MQNATYSHKQSTKLCVSVIYRRATFAYIVPFANSYRSSSIYVIVYKLRFESLDEWMKIIISLNISI